MSTNNVISIQKTLDREDEAAWVSDLWVKWKSQRAEYDARMAEIHNYVFATDTGDTEVGELGWKNSTTMPKLCQIRDNLMSNYESAIFPNDRWMTWKAYDEDSAASDKARKIYGYMENKTRMSDLRWEAKKLLADYIDYGNFYTRVDYVHKDYDTGEEIIPVYHGPIATRISPYDIVFDITATSFEGTPKVVRSLKNLGSIHRMAMDKSTLGDWDKVLERRKRYRAIATGYSGDDWQKASQFAIDGFGSLQEYFTGSTVEILEFFGDVYNEQTGEFTPSQYIIIADRCTVVYSGDLDTYDGGSNIFHGRWRVRPDSLLGMGPLENLIGLQYRLDHLENLKADAMDLAVHPSIIVQGNVDRLEFGPNSVIQVDEGGNVGELHKNIQGVIAASTEMQAIEDRMELYAGAPREAAGIRTPGEKTAFEVDSLMTAAGRVFRSKTVDFELVLEKILNAMLKTAHKNMMGSDVIAVRDEDYGVDEFMKITKDDIIGNGIIRPVGARHYGQKSKDLINLANLFNGPMGQKVNVHTSGVELARLIQDTFEIRGYNLFEKNVALKEQKETASLQNAAEEDLMVQQSQEPRM